MTTDSNTPGRGDAAAGREDAAAGREDAAADREDAAVAGEHVGRVAPAAASPDPVRRRPPPGTADEPAPRKPRGGRLLASLALLLALAALGGAGYLYYELIHQGQVRAVTAELETLRGRLATVDERFEQLAERQQAALDSFRERQAAARTATERALRQSLNEVARQAPPSTGEWRRAEAQYLLRIANHRLLMERDVEGALRLLRTADAVLAGLDDFALHEVRARLADEIGSLESIERTDVQGLFLRLEAAKRELGRLPLRIPEFLEPGPEPPPPADDFWSVLKRELAGMVQFRRLDSEVKPLLAPEEAVYLELNLRLMLERAQLAAVRREQMIFEESLATAIEWIHQYLNVEEPAVRRLLDELTSLEQVDLARPLPDIAGSLNALKQASRNPR